MVEKYYVLKCGKKASIYNSHAAVAMVTFSVTLAVSFESEIVVSRVCIFL